MASPGWGMRPSSTHISQFCGHGHTRPYPAVASGRGGCPWARHLPGLLSQRSGRRPACGPPRRAGGRGDRGRLEVPRRMGLPGMPRRRSGGVTRDEAIQTGIFALARWHLQDHGDRCRCLEGEKFGFQAAAVIDALAAEGMRLRRVRGDGPAGVTRGAERRWLTARRRSLRSQLYRAAPGLGYVNADGGTLEQPEARFLAPGPKL